MIQLLTKSKTNVPKRNIAIRDSITTAAIHGAKAASRPCPT